MVSLTGFCLEVLLLPESELLASLSLPGPSALTGRVLKSVAMAGLAVSLAACQVFNLNPDFEPDPQLERRILGEHSVDVPEVGLLDMDPALQAYLDEHVDERLRGWDLVSRLQELLFDPEYLNIQYDDAANLTAAQAFQERRANCLSLVGLYITMARHFGLQVNYQTVQVRPVWDRRGEILILSEHVNALGRLGVYDHYIVDFTPQIRLQRDTAQQVSDEEALALYFNNMAVESLLENDLQQALQYGRYAIVTDPELDIAWNTLGSILNRQEAFDLAEYSYQRAASLNRSSASVINNLARFYSMQGNEDEAERYRRAVQAYNQRNPYFHYVQGNIAFEQENFEQALTHFQRAIRRNDLEPDFYFALGSTYRQLGDEETAEEAIQLATAILELGDQTYRSTQSRVRRLDGRTILRSSSAGIRIEVAN